MYRRSLSNLLGGSLLVATAFALNACGSETGTGGETTPTAGTPATPSGNAAGTPASTGSAGKSAGSPGATATAGAKATAGTMSTTSGVSSAAGKSGGAGTTAATAGTGAAGSGTATAAAGSTATAGTTGGAAGGGMAAAGGPAMAGGTLGGPLKYTDMLTMGTTVPPKYKCPRDMIGSGMGENKSPPLAWTGGPTDTKSFAIVLYDTQYTMVHWAIWDIPPTVNMLPEGMPSGYELMDPMGAHQAADMGMDKHAYFGPCSSPGGPLPAGKYEYRLYALKVDKLGLMESSGAAAAQTAIESMMLEKVVWAAMPGM